MSAEDRFVQRVRVDAARYDELLASCFEAAQRVWREQSSEAPLWFSRYRDEVLICGRAETAAIPRATGIEHAVLALDGVLQLQSQPPLAELGVFESEPRLRLAERFFALDSALCMEWITGQTARTAPGRRELSLYLTDALVQRQLGCGAERKLFYLLGWRWAVEDGSWQPHDLDLLRTRAESQRAHLVGVLADPLEAVRCSMFGAAACRRIEQFLHDAEPIVVPLLEQASHPTTILWSLMHRHCNRLGIPGLGEAVMRYLVHHALGDQTS